MALKLNGLDPVVHLISGGASLQQTEPSQVARDFCNGGRLLTLEGRTAMNRSHSFSSSQSSYLKFEML